jgi:hypothetical protein
LISILGKATVVQFILSVSKQLNYMKFLLLPGLLPLLFLSCEKGKANTKQTCYKVRFVAEGCWTVIQLLEPLDEGLPTAQYSGYEHTFWCSDSRKI